MDIAGSTALVTGGSRGLGAAFVRELLDRGAAKVYATARDIGTVTEAGAVPVALEVTDPASVDQMARQVGDVDLLINNAGGLVGASFLGDDIDDLRRELDVNLFGPLRVARAVVPLIEANGGGHVLNVASVLSWVALGGSYSASKAALWSMSNSLRSELAPRGIGVTTLHMGYVDTDMTAAVRAPKSDPADVVRQALDGVEAGEWEVLADERSERVLPSSRSIVRNHVPPLAPSCRPRS
jgi:NAD(P)-dependent dehydrogenase (short-subunit alcohol dehydrogenase family)